MPSETDGLTSAELAELQRRFGQFGRARFEFTAHVSHFGEWVQKLMRRRGETILVVPRVQSRLLLHTKPHYPKGVYRLPTGGIHAGEDVADAARREVHEEIGFAPSSLALLGVLENVFWVDETPYLYPSYLFQTELFTGQPNPTDTNEIISGFRDVNRSGLHEVAATLAGLEGAWRDWGTFRASAHLWLAEHMDPGASQLKKD
jgi:8-oxo-dGTP diphosphatase